MQSTPVPPNNPDAERAVLGALMHPDGEEAIKKVLRMGLQVAHFYNKKTHQRAYRAILKIHNSGSAVDLVTVIGEAQFDTQIVADLNEMIDAVPTVENVEYYARLVMESAERRLYIQLAKKAVDMVTDIEDVRAGYDKILESRPLDVIGEPRAEPIDGNTFLNMEIGSTPMLIGGGLIPGVGYTIMGGYAKAGKTTFALQMALSIVSKMPLVNTFPIEKEDARVLYCFLENAPEAIQDIAKKQRDSWGAEVDPTNIIFLEAHGMCLDYREDRNWLESILTNQSIDLCIVDPVSLAMKRDQNAYEVVREFATSIKTIGRATNTAFLLIHNLKKPGAVKMDPMHLLCGSSAWSNIAESIITVGQWDETKSPSYSRLSMTLRYAQAPDDICLYRNPNGVFELYADPDRIPKARTENVVELVRDLGPVGYSALAAMIVETEKVGIATAKRKISQAVSDKLIIKGADKKYVIPLAKGK